MAEVAQRPARRPRGEVAEGKNASATHAEEDDQPDGGSQPPSD